MRSPLRELCILFLHHQNDAVTRLHFDMVRRSNPDAHLVPIANEPESALPGAIDLGRFESRWDTRDKWRSCDTMVYRWFSNRTCEARKYIVFEYDCRCDVDIRRYFAEHWAADALLPRYFEHGTTDWYWFREVGRLPEAHRAFAAGLWPMAGTILSHEALERICQVVTTEDVFSELRLATAIRRAGAHVATLSGKRLRRIQYREYPFPILAPGFYHPVKRASHNLTRVPHAFHMAVRHTLSQPVRARILSVLDRWTPVRRWLGCAD